MERSQRPYSIYKRRSKKKKGEYYFYVRFRAEDSRYLPPVASHQTSRQRLRIGHMPSWPRARSSPSASVA